MLIKATLSNTRHPEYGEVTIPLPIKTSEYDRTVEMLANLEIGNVTGRDCKIMELSSPYSILQKLEGSEVNIDELDYLAKRLESFEADQDLQFQAAAFARGVASIEDFINLTFCSDQATVIYDFTNLEAVGRQHFMNLHGGCASTEELENLDGYETALLLIDGGGAEITPYGVLYDNGMKMEQLYKGGPFPPYLYDAYELVLPISPAQAPKNKTYLYLPSSNLQLERTLLRGEIMEQEGWFHKLEPIQLSSVITEKLDTRRDSIRELNEMCRSIHQLSHVDRAKLNAAVEYRTYYRTGWNIKDNNQKFFDNEIQMSGMIGSQDGAYENFREFVDTINTPENIALEQMMIEALYQAISALSAEEQALVQGLIFNGMTEREYAEQMGVYRNAIHEKKVRVIKKIKKFIENWL